MIYNQPTIPLGASVGDVWTDHKSFKRVLSRGGAWENVNLGETHRDERKHEQSKESETEQRLDAGVELPAGADQSTQGDGDDGKVPGMPASEEDASVAEVFSAPKNYEEEPVLYGFGAPEGEDQTSDVISPEGNGGPSEEEGVDGNGSPVV